MTVRPRLVALDIIETTFSLDAMRPRLAARGLPEDVLELWFTQTLRDAFALAATGVYAPFTAIATGTLRGLVAARGLAQDPARDARVLEGFGELAPQPEAAEALHVLRDADIPVVALSNGAAATTRKLLDRAGLSGLVARVLSVEQIRTWKPLQPIYHHAAQVMRVAPPETALIATHAWDVHGAKQAGLVTGFVARGQPFPEAMAAPDLTGEDLADLARRLAVLPPAG